MEPEVGATEIVYRFLSLPSVEAAAALSRFQQDLVDMADKGNNSAKAVVYAFLDHAWLHAEATEPHAWSNQVKGVTQSMLRKVRKRNIIKEKITEPWHIDVLYGAFFGSGDPEYLRPVLHLLEARARNRLDLVQAAEWSLSSLEERFQVVREALAVIITRAEA